MEIIQHVWLRLRYIRHKHEIIDQTIRIFGYSKLKRDEILLITLINRLAHSIMNVK